MLLFISVCELSQLNLAASSNRLYLINLKKTVNIIWDIVEKPISLNGGIFERRKKWRFNYDVAF